MKPNMKKQLFLGVAGALLLCAGSACDKSYQKTTFGITTDIDSLNLEVRFYDPSTVRVVKYPDGKTPLEESFSVIASPEKTPIDITHVGDVISMKSSAMRVDVNLTDGSVAYFSAQGDPLLTEKAQGTEFTPFDDAGNPTFSVGQSFLLDDGEAIYGLGQQQYGKMNQRGQTLNLEQRNCYIAIPFINSVKGYGLLWDNPSPTTFADDDSGMSFTSKVADGVDYYFVYGGSMDSTIALVRDLTGQAPMFPLWSWGYWQSRERYVSADELVGTVQRYRDLGIPLDGIVQDWQYWSTDNNYWNRLGFGNPAFPDPKKMIDDVHALNAHAIISVWPSFGNLSEPFKEFDEKGLLLNFPTYPNENARVYNAFSPEARDIYWRYMEQNLLSTGMDGWWLDATEPEITGYEESFDTQQVGPGSFRKVRNAFPLVSVEGVYEKQRAVTSDKRVLILTRSAFTGQQRAAAHSWSGDVDGDWATFKKQIPAGLNFSASALPYWNTDIGGFWVRDGGSSAYEDYRELYVRWLQFGTFMPMMRSHGTNTPREIWQFGEKGDWAYDAIEKFIRLRYTLLPYNYSLGWNVTSRGGSIMRMLAMDFPADARVHDMGSEYMYGNSLLVVPVTEPFYTSGEKAQSTSNFERTQTYPVYLPEGADWYDFWTGEKLLGGRDISRETPIDIMPLYVRAGSIVPLGPDVQYATQKDWSDLEIRIYPGADAEFTLYEDEGDNYNYESGAYSTIVFRWDDASRTLTIDERQGSFPGMLENRTFRVSAIGDGSSQTVSYSGDKLTVKIGQ
jgi:alpha-D-xyloside xylohydrolase